MDENGFDSGQAASAAQFDRQHLRYGKSHILADTSDVAAGLNGLEVPPGGRALDVATGGGHTALRLARMGWSVSIGDVSIRVLESAQGLLGEHGFSADARLFPAEAIPFEPHTFDLVTVRVAPHHFSSPPSFLREVRRVLRPGGHLLLIDGTVPENDAETDHWLNRVEKWRDPSHVRLLPPSAWRAMFEAAGLHILNESKGHLEQPDLEWYFETAATSSENRRKVLDAVRAASPRVRQVMRLREDGNRIIWRWPMLTLLARANGTP